jgi:hypothetical protein
MSEGKDGRRPGEHRRHRSPGPVGVPIRGSLDLDWQTRDPRLSTLEETGVS